MYYNSITVHYYNYLIDGLNPNIYPIPRFSSEYGYQSMPSLSTWLTATNNTNDLVHGSNFLNHRQHLPGGFAFMDALIGQQLDLPHELDYEKYIYYSQVRKSCKLILVSNNIMFNTNNKKSAIYLRFIIKLKQLKSLETCSKNLYWG